MRNCPHLISPAFYAIKKATQLSQESLDRKKISEVVRTVCHQSSGPPTEVQTISCMFSGKRTYLHGQLPRRFFMKYNLNFFF